MIYFNYELVQIPRHFNENPLTMTLTNELTNVETVVGVVNMSTNPRMYVYHFTEDEVHLDNGTYKYNLGSEVGLMQVGDYVSPATEYNEKKQNTVYER